MEEKRVYAEIFDIVTENLRLADKSFAYKRSTFLCDVGTHPQDVCVSEYLHLPNSVFFQAVYVASMKRLPDEKTRIKWEKKEKLPRERFQKKVLKSIANSSVTAINHIRLIENPYFTQRMGLRYKMLGALYGLTDKSNLREFGKKLPEPVQKIIRKIFL